MREFIKKYKVFLLIIFIFFILLILTCCFFNFHHNKINVLNDLSKIDLDGYNKLMIVAHPDDEMLWGGAALIQDDYLVICITCGSDKERVKEFKNVMNETNDKYLMLGYPDKVMGKRSEWESEREAIAKDILTILEFKDWDMIVTHNKDGEYGHIHHKMTHSIVFSLASEEQKEHLMFFNTYCSLKQMEDNECDIGEEITEDLIKEKERIMYTYYVSQETTIRNLSHMISYEHFIKE